ncbi:MAG: glycosyltransferase family 2 protein [Bdellovibrionota bacterium]
MKKTKIHFIMPMAGRGSRFSKMGFDYPKPLIEIYGKPFFYWSTISIVNFVDVSTIDFVVLKEHIDDFNIDKKIYEYFPNANIHTLPNVTEGAVITCMEGVKHINDALPIVFNDCDHLFKCTKFYNFLNNDFSNDAKGILLTFNSNEPKYSFIQKDEKGDVIRTVEKEVISSEAICGCYYFESKDIFLSSAQEYLTKCNYNEYFTSGVYNVMIENNCCVKNFSTDFHVSFGIPEEYEEALQDDKYKELL